MRRQRSGECVTKSVTAGHEQARLTRRPACLDWQRGRIRARDLWVMSGHAAVSHRPTHTTDVPREQPTGDAAVSALPLSTARCMTARSQIWSPAHQGPRVRPRPQPGTRRTIPRLPDRRSQQWPRATCDVHAHRTAHRWAPTSPLAAAELCSSNCCEFGVRDDLRAPMGAQGTG